MSAENVDVVRNQLEQFQGVDLAEIDWGAEPIREILAAGNSPNVELRTLESGTGAGVDAVYRGLDGLARYLGDWMEPFSEYRVESFDFIDEGEFVQVPSSQWGVGGGSGARVEHEITWACEVKDGRITRILQYDTVQQARDAIASETT
jgi:hypothetical protein